MRRLWRDQRRRCHIQPQACEGETARPSCKVPVDSTSSLDDARKDTPKGFFCASKNSADIINHRSCSKTFSVTELLSERACSLGRRSFKSDCSLVRGRGNDCAPADQSDFILNICRNKWTKTLEYCPHREKVLS